MFDARTLFEAALRGAVRAVVVLVYWLVFRLLNLGMRLDDLR